MTALVAVLAMAVAAVAGYTAGRLRPWLRLQRYSWRRIVLGPRDGERKLDHLDVAVYTLLHPLWWARKPPPEPERIDLNELFFRAPEEKP